MATRTAGIRFRQAGKVYYYDAGDLELEPGQYVVVETSHGLAVGRVVISPDQVIANESSGVDDQKQIVRLATLEDIEQSEAMRERANEALLTAKERVSEMGLDMSVASGEFDLDGGQFTAYFTAQERVDFRNLVRELSKDLGAHVQLLQVGDRDRAKLVDGVDVCGERLCCSSWMTNFPSVSIRMAKEQDLPLNPQKISGVCGRLYCCLTFEYEDYKALRGTLPKVGSTVSTPAGAAKVTGIDFNREVVRLYLIDSHTPIEIDAIDFKLQNGVTIRPIELVRKIEGQYRSISEDRPEGTSAPPSRPGGRGRGPRPERDARPAQQGRPGGRRPQPQPRDVVSEAEQIAAAAAAAAAAKQAQQQQQGEGAADDAQRRRRRRRRRGGRGGSGEGAGPAPSE
jgi:cell fate regulator YaaT (PSP1 superfamily)